MRSRPSGKCAVPDTAQAIAGQKRAVGDDSDHTFRTGIQEPYCHGASPCPCVRRGELSGSVARGPGVYCYWSSATFRSRAATCSPRKTRDSIQVPPSTCKCRAASRPPHQARCACKVPALRLSGCWEHIACLPRAGHLVADDIVYVSVYFCSSAEGGFLVFIF